MKKGFSVFIFDKVYVVMDKLKEFGKEGRFLEKVRGQNELSVVDFMDFFVFELKFFFNC